MILKILIVNAHMARVMFQRVKIHVLALAPAPKLRLLLQKKKPYLQIPYISQIPHIMRPYVEDIVNVRGDGNCGFRVVARHMGLNEEDRVLVCHALINELKNHNSDYLPIYATESRYKLILDG